VKGAQDARCQQDILQLDLSNFIRFVSSRRFVFAVQVCRALKYYCVNLSLNCFRANRKGGGIR
jgi:hypothetical protein